jgi:hypothetical protein
MRILLSCGISCPCRGIVRDFHGGWWLPLATTAAATRQTRAASASNGTATTLPPALLRLRIRACQVPRARHVLRSGRRSAGLISASAKLSFLPFAAHIDLFGTSSPTCLPITTSMHIAADPAQLWFVRSVPSVRGGCFRTLAPIGAARRSGGMLRHQLAQGADCAARGQPLVSGWPCGSSVQRRPRCRP